MPAATPPIAPFASDPARSRGRRHDEPEAADRTAFQRDRDRIIHSGAFRRLKHKTQVFVSHEGDYYRTRLTHSLEVAQIARSIARALGLNEDLAEALALAHDFGHPPFGHAGEEALDAAMADYGGFDHNDQTLRVLTRLERRYAAFDGLNLTWETLEGTVKHNGPIAGAGRQPPPGIAAFDREYPLDLATQPGPEAQVAALSDDIAYNNHDIDDGLRAGLFSIEDLLELPLVGPIFRSLLDQYPNIETQRLIHEAVRRMINAMVTDVIAETRRRIAEAAPRSVEAVRAMPRPLVAFSPEMEANNGPVKAFLFHRMYRHYRVNRMSLKARQVVQSLFAGLLAEPSCLPTEWQAGTDGPGGHATARVVADYIAGMTDRFALDEHDRLFNIHART
ncbi:MAG: deoxyguanosinetriphosphate triphosphohydrolase [Thalassobaculales bacterium]